MNNEEMKRSLRELCRIESVAGIDVSDDAPYGAGCAQADIESGKLTMNVGTIGVTDVNLVMEIDVRAPVTFEADAVTEPLRRAAAEYGIEVELTQDTPPVYMDKNGDVRPVDTRKHTPKKAEQARMSSLRRLGIHKVCLRRRALTSHLLRHFWCFAVLKLRFLFLQGQSHRALLTYSQGFGHLRAKKIFSKPYVFLRQPAWSGFFCRYLSVMPRNAAHLPSARRAPRTKPVSVRFLKILSSSPSMQAVM